MDKPLREKISTSISWLNRTWQKQKSTYPFIAFSTGKDSLAMAALMYEAIEPDRLICLYSHHDLEFPSNLEYANQMNKYFDIRIISPNLNYFELIERGIGFLTLKDPWCVPFLVGTSLMQWLHEQGARSPHEGLMFRGMSGSEYSHKFHTKLELYKRLDLPTYNPLLNFTKEDIIKIISDRYGLPLNPIYDHMDRSYCICCYTSDAKRQFYSSNHYPDKYIKYYQQIEAMLFDSGLVEKVGLKPEYRTREEKLCKHGFIHWRRTKLQDRVGAIKRKHHSGFISYYIKNNEWIDSKHLMPLNGHWLLKNNEIRFWEISETKADVVIKRMINCLDCGFCAVECLSHRRFNSSDKRLEIDDCIQCGKCLTLKFCMGWKHRFWRRLIKEIE